MNRVEVEIGGRSYPLKLSEEEVTIIQKVVAQINARLKDLQVQYQRQDLQDRLSMTLLTYALEYEKIKSNEDLSPISDRLTNIDNLLDQALQS